jgi:hypothetical protein
VFWGHPFSSGIIDSIDYYIIPRGGEANVDGSDNIDSQERYSEQLVRFDSLGSYYMLVEDIPDETPWFDSFNDRLNTLQSLAAVKTITFMDGAQIPPHHKVFSAPLYATLQHCGKFHPLFDATLLKILAADPHAVLMIRSCSKDSNKDTNDGLREFSKNWSSDEYAWFGSRLGDLFSTLSERIVILQEQIALGSLMRLFGAAHVALEPFPFPASITSLDAFMVRYHIPQTPPLHTSVLLVSILIGIIIFMLRVCFGNGGWNSCCGSWRWSSHTRDRAIDCDAL